MCVEDNKTPFKDVRWFVREKQHDHSLALFGLHT